MNIEVVVVGYADTDCFTTWRRNDTYARMRTANQNQVESYQLLVSNAHVGYPWTEVKERILVTSDQWTRLPGSRRMV